MSVTPKLLSLSLKRYVIPVVIVILVFFATDYILVKSIKQYYLNVLETQLTSFGKVYSHTLAKGAEAYSLISDLLEEKIIGAGKTAAAYAEQLGGVSNASLACLAEMLRVDEILVYSPEGVVEYANDGDLAGFRPPPEHPLYGFVSSGQETLVEDIRRNLVTREYYKYGYVRGRGGRVVQVGVNADRIQQALAPFEVVQLLEEIAGLELVSYISYADSRLDSTTSDDRVMEPLFHQDTVEAASLMDSIQAVTHSHDGEDVYEVYVPVHAGGQRIGTLTIGKQLYDTRSMGRKVSILSVIASGAVLAGFLYIMVTNYQYNKRLAMLAYHDPNTGLPNRPHLEHILETRWRKDARGRHAVLMIHCLNLGTVNSVYGFNVGDQVLTELAQRLRPFQTEKCRLFHFPMHRFVLYVTDYDSREALAALVRQVHAVLQQPLDALGVSTQITAKTGTVELNGEQRDVDQVFAEALVALQHAEEGNGGQAFAFFDEEMAANLRRQEAIAREMREFLFHNAPNMMHLEYQPKVHLHSNRIVGFEALARMDSPTWGRVPPDEFIRIAERQDLIVPLGYWVLETACKFIKNVAEAGHRDLHVAVNISGIQLLNDDFAGQVSEIMARTGVKSSNLELEITESVLIEGYSSVRRTLFQLRDMGIKIAIDDFGTGYSSLARMESLPVDSIKIHKYFVDSILAKSDSKLIIPDLISMAHNLGLEVVAEGVEHEAQRVRLLEWGCDIIQGYLFSRPLPQQEALLKLQTG